MIRVLLAEDSAVTREYLAYLLESDPVFEVVGQALDGEEAVQLAEALRPDVIVMDIEMPRMNGYEATRQIMERAPAPIVMVSAHSGELEARGFESLRAGALVLVNKPTGPGQPDSAATSLRFLETVKLMAEVKVVRRWAQPLPGLAPSPPSSRLVPATPIRVVAIGASAGGPPAVAEILGGLPSDLACPILLVQHIAPGFAAGLAEWLDRTGPPVVKLAELNEPAVPGKVYVAPDAVHLGISKSGLIQLTTEPESDGFRPSVSHLLRSAAGSYGAAALGIVLTGMGRDGADGLLELRRQGGTTIAQDEASCVVYGMPMQAVRLGAAQHVLPPTQIAEAIRTLVGSRRSADRSRDGP